MFQNETSENKQKRKRGESEHRSDKSVQRRRECAESTSGHAERQQAQATEKPIAENASHVTLDVPKRSSAGKGRAPERPSGGEPEIRTSPTSAERTSLRSVQVLQSLNVDILHLKLYKFLGLDANMMVIGKLGDAEAKATTARNLKDEMAGNFSASASEEENSDANLKTKSPDNTKTKAKGPPTLPKTVKDPYLTCLLHCIMAPRTFSDTQQFQFAIDDLKYKSGCFMKGAMAKEIRRAFDRSLDDDCDIFCGIKVRQENALRSFLVARDSHGGSDEDTKQKFLKRLSWRFSEDLNILTSECYKYVGRGTWCNEDMLQWLLKANRFEHSVKHVLDDGNCLFYAIQKGLEHGEILQPSRNSTFERDLRWFVTEYIEIFCKGSNLESLPFAKATEESIMLEAQQSLN
jgi:hypothetical protein